MEPIFLEAMRLDRPVSRDAPSGTTRSKCAASAYHSGTCNEALNEISVSRRRIDNPRLMFTC